MTEIFWKYVVSVVDEMSRQKGLPVLVGRVLKSLVSATQCKMRLYTASFKALYTNLIYALYSAHYFTLYFYIGLFLTYNKHDFTIHIIVMSKNSKFI